MSIQKDGSSTVEQLSIEPKTEAEMQKLNIAKIESKNLLTGNSQDIYREKELDENTYLNIM